MVICSLKVSHHLSRAPRDPGRSALHAAPLRNLRVWRLPGLGRGLGACPELLGALDSYSLGLTLNLQLSTFNRVSFLSPSSLHLCALCVLCGENSSSFRSSLMPRHSPLITNSFTIRTSETPLPQLLYNPHLQAPLGSAGNKGLITPLESALTKKSPVSLLESALAERWGVGPCFPPGTRHSSLVTCNRIQVLLFSYTSKLYCTRQKLNPFVFIQFQPLCAKHRGVGAVSYRMVSISASRETWVAGKPLIENLCPPDSEK